MRHVGLERFGNSMERGRERLIIGRIVGAMPARRNADYLR